VYAVRNLTEDNSRNQDLIAKMEDQGLADASLLKKMGFEVEKRGEKLILKSTSDSPPLVSALMRTGLCLTPESWPHVPMTLAQQGSSHLGTKQPNRAPDSFLFRLYTALSST
jgi:hypothetical protein